MDTTSRIMAGDPSVPQQIQDLVGMAQRTVGEVIGVEPDLTPETLPLVDQYLRDVPQDTSEEVLDLVLSSVGCYFGEVVRRKLNGRWALPDDDPNQWRIELISCFLHFRPVGMAGEVFRQVETDGFDGSFGTLDELSDAMELMLAQTAPMSEEEYYSLSGRVDVLQLATDWLVGQTLVEGKRPISYSAEDYGVRLDPADQD